MSPMAWLSYFLQGATFVAFLYFASLLVFYALTTTAAVIGMRRRHRRLGTLRTDELLRMGSAPAVTVIAPAFNEEAVCVDMAHSLESLEHPSYEVILVNDGSTDDTVERLKDAYDMREAERVPVTSIPTAPVRAIYRSRSNPRIWLIDKDNGGKADALNAGVNYTQTPLFCAIDADTLLEPRSLLRLTRPFIEDTSTVAVGGIVRPVNGSHIENGTIQDVRMPRRLLARLQVVEYIRAFFIGRMGWASLGSTLIISGALGMFRREDVVAVGGYLVDTVGEDMELIVRLHRHSRQKGKRYRIEFSPHPTAWTEVPVSVRVLARQRDRWQRGLIETLIRHRGMFFNPAYGVIGMFGMPYYVLLHGLGPFIEIIGVTAFIIAASMGLLSSTYALAFVSLAFGVGIALSAASIALEDMNFRKYHRGSDLFWMFTLAVIENIGYRQMVSFFRMRAIVSYLRGKSSWGTMNRVGFLDSSGTGKKAALAILASAMMLAGATAGSAQEADDPRWSSTAAYTTEWFEGDALLPWRTASFETGRSFSRGTGIVRLGADTRYEETDGWAQVVAYRDLWSRAYTRASLQVAPGAEILPSLDVSVGLNQGLKGGWEVSGGYRMMRTAGDAVHIGSGSLAHYVGPCYLRGGASVAIKGGTTGESVSGLGRCGTGEMAITTAGAIGREVVTLSPGEYELRRTEQLSIDGTLPLGRIWSVTAGLRGGRFEGQPLRGGVHLGLGIRW